MDVLQGCRGAPEHRARAIASGIARDAGSIEALLGIEGTAARRYFGEFTGMLKGSDDFDLEGRNRRLPRDPVNALLGELAD